MVKAGADRPDDMLLHGQLTIKQDAKVAVADNVGQFNDGREDVDSMVFWFQSTERGLTAEPDKLRLGGIELKPAWSAPFFQLTDAGREVVTTAMELTRKGTNCLSWQKNDDSDHRNWKVTWCKR